MLGVVKGGGCWGGISHQMRRVYNEDDKHVLLLSNMFN